MAKNKSVLISGNPFVQVRENRDGDRLSMRLVYNLGDVYEVDEEGNRRRRQQWKYEKLQLWMWNKKHLTPAESEHNRQAKETARIVREEREKEFRTKTHGYVFATDRAKVNLYEWMEDYISEYDKADVRVVQLALKRFREFVKGNRRYALFSQRITPDQLTPDLVEDFVAQLEKDCVGEGAHTLYKRFKKMVTAATKKGLFVENPCDGITAHIEDEGRLKKDVLTAEEITKLVQCHFDRQSEDVRRAFLFSLFTGLRYWAESMNRQNAPTAFLSVPTLWLWWARVNPTSTSSTCQARQPATRLCKTGCAMPESASTSHGTAPATPLGPTPTTI